jgi:hypothetical protein
MDDPTKKQTNEYDNNRRNLEQSYDGEKTIDEVFKQFLREWDRASIAHAFHFKDWLAKNKFHIVKSTE